MRVQYHPKHFLRQVPNAMLEEFFQRRDQLTDLKWQEMSEMDVDPIFDAWLALPEPERAEVERSFRAISDLSCPEGLQTVIEEGRFHGVDLMPCLAADQGLHEKIFWVYLNYPKVFVAAGRLNRADHLNGRYWRRRTDLPAKKPDLSHPMRELLTREISNYYRTEQGRGEHCTVEVYLRRENLHYFFAYPADYADTVVVYNDEGDLERHVQKAAFEVVFAYNETSGTLDVFVQGDKKVRRAMEEIFARLILKEDLPEDCGRQPYELNGLRRSDFDFPTDPKDGIQSTRIKGLRLSIAGPGFGRITFESDARRKRGDIYDLMEKTVNHAEGLWALNVTRAVFEVVFANGDKPKTVSFQITYPDSCSLKDTPEDLKLKDCLRRWGIASENQSD